MRDDICTIPISEVFEENDGCPICRMYKTVNDRVIKYILGDAMMEPDVRIMTNTVGFCDNHYNQMLENHARLQLSLMLQTHIEHINKEIIGKKPDKKKKSISNSCFVCDKIEWGTSRMIETIFRCYENEEDFRKMFNGQKAFCLPHYELLMNIADKKKMRKHYTEFCDNLSKITLDYSKNLYDNLTAFCAMYDYRSNSTPEEKEKLKSTAEDTIKFLSHDKLT